MVVNVEFRTCLGAQDYQPWVTNKDLKCAKHKEEET